MLQSDAAAHAAARTCPDGHIPDTSQSHRRAMTPATPPPSDSPTLLIVDDDHAIRCLLTESLGQHGYRVETAASAQEMDMALARHPIRSSCSIS